MMKMLYKQEIIDILIAVAGLTLIFSFTPFSINLAGLPVYFLAVVTAFLCHEIAHKLVAMKFGCVAFFKLWPTGLLIGLVLMLVGVKFVAPGAVMIYPFTFSRWGYRRRHLTETESGIISVAGPLVNLTFTLVFSLLGGIFSLLAFVNGWLFLFNMLPVPPLDGSKVMRWNVALWTVLFIIGLTLVVPYFL